MQLCHQAALSFPSLGNQNGCLRWSLCSLIPKIGLMPQLPGAAARLSGEMCQVLRAQSSVWSLLHPKAQDPGSPYLLLMSTHLEIITHQQVQHQQVTEESAKIGDDTLSHGGSGEMSLCCQVDPLQTLP